MPADQPSGPRDTTGDAAATPFPRAAVAEFKAAADAMVSGGGWNPTLDTTSGTEVAIDTVAVADATRKILADTTARMVRRVATHAERAARDPKTFSDWLEDGINSHTAVVSEAMNDPLSAFKLATGHPDFESGQAGDDMAKWLLGAMAKKYNDLLDTVTPKNLELAVKLADEILEAELPLQAASEIC